MRYTSQQRSAFALLVLGNALIVVALVKLPGVHEDIVVAYAVVMPIALRILFVASEQHSPRVVLDGIRVWRAIGRGEIVFHYQPKVDLATGQPVGVEALARWKHPTKGVLPPASWLAATDLPWLEKRFLHHALTTILTQAATWRDRGWDLTVCINIGPRTFSDPQFALLLRGHLSRHVLPASCVVIELTEEVLDFSPETARVADELAALGVGLALDDFGIGHSSMDRLVRLPIRELKIDRSFVTNFTRNTRQAAVAAAAIRMAHSLGMECVAEGIEDPDCLQAMRREGCDIGQGYLISRPLPPDELDTWIEGGHWQTATVSLV